LRGARQIGKSTAVRRLAERNKHLDATFATLDVNLIIDELQIVARKKISENSHFELDILARFSPENALNFRKTLIPNS
jgi:hypothetical protein